MPVDRKRSPSRFVVGTVRVRANPEVRATAFPLLQLETNLPRPRPAIQDKPSADLRSETVDQPDGTFLYSRPHTGEPTHWVFD